MGDIFVGVKLILKLKFITAFSILFLTKSDSLDDFFFDDSGFWPSRAIFRKGRGSNELEPLLNAGMLR